MELDEFETLRLVEERIILKVHSFRTWADFIVWAKGMTQAKFKTFILQCMDDVVSDGDAKKVVMLEKKAQLEG